MRLVVAILLASVAWGQTFSGYAVDVKSHSTARIGWTTDSAISYWNVEWDTQASPPFPNATNYRNDTSAPYWAILTAGNPTSSYAPYGHACLDGYKVLVSGATGGWSTLNGLRTCTYVDATHFTVDADTTGATGLTYGTARYMRWEETLAGLPANTTIYYRVCHTSGSTCDAVQNFTTDAAPANVFSDPTLPTASGALSSLPGSYAYTETEVTNCGSLQTAINTALARGAAGHVLLPIQKGLSCSFATNPGLSIGANTNTGYLVIRSAAADTELPPAGVRISSNWTASMVTFSSTQTGGSKKVLSLANTDRIYLMGIIFTNDFPSGSVKTITGATAASPIVYTSTAHGFSNNDVVQIREVGGVTGANVTNCKVQNKTDDTFECKSSSGTGSYTSGGYAVKTPPQAPSLIDARRVGYLTVDRCIFYHVWPDSAMSPSVIVARNGAYEARSTDVNLINSYAYDIHDWNPTDPDDGTKPSCCANTAYEGMFVIAADRVLVQNNKLDIPGISLFDDSGKINDLTYRRNLNDWGQSFRQVAGYTNLSAAVRQQFEMKSCFRCYLDGNQFLNQWRGGYGQGTGGYNSPVLFSGRSSHDGFTGDYAFSDLTITNNVIANAPGGIHIGNAGGYQFTQKSVNNVLIKNNLMYGMDWEARDGLPSTIAGTGNPSFLVFDGEFENLRVENNTMWDNRSGANGWNRAWALSSSRRGAYLRVWNNIWAHNHNASYGNVYWTDTGTVLPAPDNTPHTDAFVSKFLHDVVFAGNIVVPGVTNSTAEANYSDGGYNYSQATCASYWTSLSGVTCHGTSEANAYARFTTVGFFDYTTTNRNFRLKHSSSYVSGGANRGSDDKNVGADIDAIDAAIGKVKNTRARAITASTATISYTAPDSDACTVEYSTSATWGTGSRTSDGGGDRVRNVDLSGLSSATGYYYRVLCAAEQPNGTFTTN